MSSVPRYRRLVLSICALGVLGVVLWIGCGSGEQDRAPAISQDSTLSLPRLDPACEAGKPPTTRDELNACLKGFQFDERDLAGDRQRLMIFDPIPGPGCPGAPKIRNCRLGPLATIKPETHSNQWNDTTLVQEGRFIARMSLDSGEKAYPKLALYPNHLTFWWVLKGSGGKPGISRYITDSVKADGTLLYKEHTLQVETYRDGSLKHAVARWFWVADDETTKGTCSSGSSCK